MSFITGTNSKLEHNEMHMLQNYSMIYSKPLSIKKIYRGNKLYSKDITSLTALQDSSIIIGSKDGTVMKCKLILQGQISIKKLFCNKLHTDTVSYITAFDRNNIISCSFDGNIKISIVMKDGFQEKSFFKCHDGHIRKIILLENNRFASCGNDHYIKIINSSVKIISDKFKEDSDISSIIKVKTKKGYFIVSSCPDTNSINLWDLNVSKKIQELKNVYTSSPNGIVELKGGLIAVVNNVEPYLIKIVDVIKFEVIKEINENIKHNASIYLKGNDLCCVCDGMLNAFAVSNFAMKGKFSDEDIKQNKGTAVVLNENYMVVSNCSNGVNVYYMK
jgi:WD40 repeat protein